MTTPGGVSNLPVGALTPETMLARLEDMSGNAMRARAGERFPSIMGVSSGGSPLADITPFGILTRIWAEFNSAVANADPADINGPDDLPELLLKFIEELPVVGEFVGLLEAILGTYDGDDEILLQIQQLFRFLRPDGMLDASKLFGELPQVMLQAIVSLLSGGLLGNIELGQLIRPILGQERNWLESFDKPESVPAGDGFEHDATVGRTRLGSARVTFDGAEHVRTSDPIDVAPGQVLSIGGYMRWANFTGSGPAMGLRVLAYNSGDQLIGSQLVGTVSPSTANASDFETKIEASWTAPAATAYCYVRMEAYAGATGGTGHFDDLWLRKPAQNLPQAWISGLVEDLGNLFGWLQAWVQHGLNALDIPIVGDFFQQITDLADGFGSWQAQTDGTQADLDDLLSGLLSDPMSVIGEIPRALVGGLDDALELLLPKTDWTKFLTGFTAAGNNGTAPSTGIPALDGLINSFLGVRTTATGAQDTATAVQGTVQQQAVTMGTVDGLTVVYTQITSTQTWNRSAIPAGCTERVKTGVGLVGSGQGGSKPSRSSKQAAFGTSGNTGSYFECPSAPGGVGGGYIYAEFDPATVGASQTVTIGAGGAGATSNGAAGSYGGTTSFGSLLSIASGAGGGVSTSLGIALAGGAGRGGAGGMATGYVNSIGANVSVYDDNGKQGDPAYRVQGGSGGTGNGGNGGAGQNAPTDDSFLTGGSGGGGGSAGGSSGGAGGAGGVPGGGGGAGGGANPGSPGNGGAGGRGEALIAEYFR
ncbi:hypothetical protein [Tsukamurella tyrosinosolvens]|uniref:hypothetical protein n=1 Tax=Tsukamurella tyrosinosolvens TaxID=57704 RepID=UPI00346326F5